MSSRLSYLLMMMFASPIFLHSKVNTHSHAFTQCARDRPIDW